MSDEIRVGQVWESRDHRDSGRTVTVEEIDPSRTFAWIRSVRLSRIRVENLQRYYRLHSDAGTDR